MERDDEYPGAEEPYGQDETDTAGGRGSRGCGVIGCLLIVVLLVGLGAGALALGNAFEPLADRYLWAPHDVVREYLDAHERGDAERARRFLCSDVRAGRPPDPGAPAGAASWTAFVEDEFPYPRAGGRWGIYYALDVPGRSTPARAQALLEREDEGWRICAFD